MASPSPFHEKRRFDTPDISVLSDEFSAEVRQFDKKNLPFEALKQLINGDVHSQTKRNLMQTKLFSERLEAAITRYHANALTTATARVLEELIEIAKDIPAAHARGDEAGLKGDEITFSDRTRRARQRLRGDGGTGAAGDRPRACPGHRKVQQANGTRPARSAVNTSDPSTSSADCSCNTVHCLVKRIMLTLMIGIAVG